MNTQPYAFSLLTVVVERGRGERLAAALADCRALCPTVLRGRGTAGKKLLSYLGLGESEKDLLLTVVASKNAKELTDAVASMLRLKSAGTGIAFAVPIHALAGHAARVSPQEDAKQEEPPMETPTHQLIIAIMNHGYADDVMDTARDAGAPGGTVLKAHGAGWKQAEKFLGITLQPDKDLLMILAPAEDCAGILSAVVERHGLEHDARAVAFALPVSHVAGLAGLK